MKQIGQKPAGRTRQQLSLAPGVRHWCTQLSAAVRFPMASNSQQFTDCQRRALLAWRHRAG